MSFACSLFAAGGWEKVDSAYDRPPTTTAHVLFPELYLTGWQPAQPATAGSPGAGWTELRTTNFGAIDLLVLFSAPGDDPSLHLSGARDRVKSWGGGEVAVWTRGDETAVSVSLIDRGEGPVPLCDSMRTWAEAAFHTPGGSVEVECDRTQILVGIGPDQSIAAGFDLRS
ncbi:MAG: hypothetical protein ACT4OP_04620 [Actinomycetota bacterium]